MELHKTSQEAGGGHYGKVQPWHLQEHMESSGSAYVDARRADAIKYSFRMKGKGDQKVTKLLDDLKKAKHCLEAAIKHMEAPKC